MRRVGLTLLALALAVGCGPAPRVSTNTNKTPDAADGGAETPNDGVTFAPGDAADGPTDATAPDPPDDEPEPPADVWFYDPGYFGDSPVPVDLPEPTDASDEPDDADNVDLNLCPKPPPTGAPCNPYCQLGCVEGEACMYLGAGAFGCTVAGAKEVSAPCAGFQECKPGMGCFGVTGDPQTTCHKLCIDDGDCPADRPCVVNVNLSGGVVITVCADPPSSCSPFEPPWETCGPGLGCYVGGPAATKCMVEGTLPMGATCWGQAVNACTPAMQCFVTCQAICSTTPGSSDQPKCETACASGMFTTVKAAQGIGVCVTSQVPKVCELHGQTGCAAGEGCYTVQGGWGCLEAGKTPKGGECIYTDSCLPGLICVDSACSAVCSLEPGAPVELQCDFMCPGGWAVLEPAAWNTGICL